MRHRVYGKHLGRDKNARTALFKNLVRSLIIWEKIETTESKAKAVKGIVDKLINSAKTPNTRRLVSQFLIDKKASEKLIKDLSPRLKNRQSGYTSVIKLGKRLGDGAMMVQMKLLLDDVVKEKIASKDGNKEIVESLAVKPNKEEKEVIKPKVKNQKVKVQVKSKK